MARHDLMLVGAMALMSQISGASTTHAMTTAYSFGVSGNVVACRFQAQASTTLTSIGFYVSASVGAPGQLTIQLRNASSNTVPGSTIHASTTATPSGVGWVKATFGTPFTLVAGTWYYVVIGDAAGSAISAWTLRVSPVMGLTSTHSFHLLCASMTSTNGFSTGTQVGAFLGFLTFGDGTFMGCPYSAAGTPTNNTLRRGIVINGFKDNLVLCGVSGTLTSVSAIEIYEGSAAPGSPSQSDAVDAVSIAVGAARITPYTFRAGGLYRVVFTFSGNSQVPLYNTIESSGAFADLLGASFMQGTVYNTIDNNAGSWSDDPASIYRISLLLRDQEYLTSQGVTL